MDKIITYDEAMEDAYTVPASTAQLIYYLEKISSGQSPDGFIATQKDWSILDEIIKVWSVAYPDMYRLHLDNIKKIRKANDATKGIAKDKGGAEIRHTVEIPEKLLSLVRAIFPSQNLDKSFIYKFAKRYPIFSVVGKI